MHQAIYKCRLCGESFVFQPRNIDSKMAESYIDGYLRPLMSFNVEMQKEEKHRCPDGGFGIADFQGFRKVGD